MMKKVTVLMTGCVFVSCVFAQENVASVDQQFAEIAEDVKAWKKNVAQDPAPRKSIELLLSQAADFQKAYHAASSSAAKSKMIDEYLKQRDELLRETPIAFVWLHPHGHLCPFSVVFDKSGMAFDAHRPFQLMINNKTRMLFSYKESLRFANMFSRLIDTAKKRETTRIPTRHCTVEVKEDGTIWLYRNTGEEALRVPEIDARLLIAHIHHVVLKTFLRDEHYAEPVDLDPALTLFASPLEAMDTSMQPDGVLTFDASRIKATQGQNYGNTRVLQQLDYRATFRWNGKQPLDVQVVMFLLSSPNNKLSIVGRSVKKVTVEPGRMNEQVLSAVQVIPGPTANGVIVQCFARGVLLKSYASSAQHRKYAEAPDIESQLPPLYKEPPNNLPAATR